MKKIADLVDLQSAGAQGFELDGTPFFVVLSPEDQQPRVYKNSCPHLGIPLEITPHQFLDGAGEYIVCAHHGALFQLDDGLCIAGPCVNKALQSVPFQIIDTGVYVEYT